MKTQRGTGGMLSADAAAQVAIEEDLVFLDFCRRTLTLA
jgi:hypothetical protein